MFGQLGYKLLPRDYQTILAGAEEYDNIIKEFEDAIQGNHDGGRSRSARHPERRLGDFWRAIEEIGAAAANQEAALSDFAREVDERLAKERGKEQKALSKRNGQASITIPDVGEGVGPPGGMPEALASKRPKPQKIAVKDVVPKELLDEIKTFIAENPVPEQTISDEDRAKAEEMLRPVIEKAQNNKPSFDAAVTAAADAIGGTELLPNIKKIDLAAEKLVLENKFDVSKMKDILRASILIHDEEHARQALEELGRHFTIDRVKDRFAKPTDVGYSDMLVNVVLDDGSNAEVLLLTNKAMATKELSHRLYEIIRTNPTDSYQVGRATALSLALNKFSLTRDSNSSWSTGMPLYKTEATGKGLASGVNAKADFQSGDIMTGMSSTSRINQPSASNSFQSISTSSENAQGEHNLIMPDYDRRDLDGFETGKTVLTKDGPLRIDGPRNRHGGFASFRSLTLRTNGASPVLMTRSLQCTPVA